MSEYEWFAEMRDEAERQGMQVDVDSSGPAHIVTVDHEGYFGKGRAQYYRSLALLLALEDLKKTKRRYRWERLRQWWRSR